MRRILSSLVVAAAVFGIIALASAAMAGPAQAAVVGFLTAEGGLGDQSYNDMTMAGLTRAKDELGVELVYVVPKPGEEGLDKGMQKLIDDGAEFIVANGFTMFNTVKKFAEKYPGKYFLLNDMPLADMPNVVSTTFGQHEGSFLVGALSVWMSPNKKVGFVGGNEFPIIYAFLEGWKEGVAYADPAAETIIEFVAPGKDVSGFNNPRQANKVATQMFNNGADVVYGVAGLSGNGVIHAAKKAGKYAVGVDSDQDHLAEGNVLTSMMKRLDNVSFNEVQAWLAGGFQPGIKDYNLANGGVSLSPMTYTKDKVPAEVMAQVEDAKQKIISGEIQVTNFLAQ